METTIKRDKVEPIISSFAKNIELILGKVIEPYKYDYWIQSVGWRSKIIKPTITILCAGTKGSEKIIILRKFRGNKEASTVYSEHIEAIKSGKLKIDIGTIL